MLVPPVTRILSLVLLHHLLQKGHGLKGMYCSVRKAAKEIKGCKTHIGTNIQDDRILREILNVKMHHVLIVKETFPEGPDHFFWYIIAVTIPEVKYKMLSRMDPHLKGQVSWPIADLPENRTVAL